MITAKVSIKNLQSRIKKIEKQSAFANVSALTTTAWDVRSEEIKALDRYLDNPTPYTKRAYRVKRATKSRPWSKVYAAQVQNNYLAYQVFGGSVSKRVPVPPTTAKNKYGNLPRTATKRKRAYSVQAGGKSYTFQRTGKRTTKLIGTWSNARSYSAILPFHRIAKAKAHSVYGRNLKRAFKKAMLTAR